MVLTSRLLDWESTILTTRPLRLTPICPKYCIKKGNNTVCSSINSPSNLLNNVFPSLHYLGFNIKFLFFFIQNFRSFPDFVSKLVKTAGFFFTRWWESEEEWLWWFENFSKLKTAFCEYWTSIKIKISMICVLKEYEIKTKMVQEQWLQLKRMFLFFIRLNWLLVGGNKNLVGRESISKFFDEWGTPPSPQ